MKNAAVVSGNVLARKCIFLQCMIFQTHINSIIGNPGVTHSVPTAFIDGCSGYRMGHTNAVGTEWVTQMHWVQNGSNKCSGYGIMGHTWVTEDALIHGKFCMLLSSAVVFLINFF